MIKKCHVTDTGPKPTSMIKKRHVTDTGPNRPFRCLEVCKTSKHLVGWGDIRAAMDPTIVLGEIGVQTVEFTAGWEHFKYLYQEHSDKDARVTRTRGYLIGSPKY